MIKQLLERRLLLAGAALLSSAAGVVLGWPSVLRAVVIALLLLAASSAIIVLGARVQHLLVQVQQIDRDSGSLWALTGLAASSSKLLPPLMSGGIRPPAALALAQAIVLYKPREIVELGPGASSFLIVQAAQSVPYETRLTTIEHDHSYYELATQTFEYLGLHCELILAPLERWEGYGYQTEWYAPDRLQELPNQIDLLIVDGPHAHDGVPRRFPAYPMFRQILAPGALIFVDDTDRVEEREMVTKWRLMDDGLQLLQDGGSFLLLKRD